MRLCALAKVNLPANVLKKRLASGVDAYYWNVPTWARKANCPLRNEALGTDLEAVFAKARLNNEALDAWRKGESGDEAPAPGTVDWFRDWFEKHPKVVRKSHGTRRNYKASMKLLADHELLAGRRFGTVQLAAVKVGHADALYERIQWVEEKNEAGEVVKRRRLRVANECMKAARRMWFLAMRAFPETVTSNPFVKMELEGTGGNTVPAEHGQVVAFMCKADEMGHPSMGTAAILAFELCQRETDVRCTIAWADYKPGVSIRVRQSKTGELVTLPLRDHEGPLYPAVEARLNETPKRGPLIVMRDKKDKRKKAYLSYGESWFQHVFREIADAAGLPRSFTFRSLRHGGLTELGDSGASEQGLRAHSGHKNARQLATYVKVRQQQAALAARRRLAWRTEQADLSERTSTSLSE